MNSDRPFVFIALFGGTVTVERFHNKLCAEIVQMWLTHHNMKVEIFDDRSDEERFSTVFTKP